MHNHIQTIFNNVDNVSSRAEQFYQDYWTNGTSISKETHKKNSTILNYFFPNGLSSNTVLEIGVGGEGGLIYQLKDKNFTEGIDVSDSAIRNCADLGLQIKKINMDSDKLPFDNDHFDVIFACEVFEHFANPQFAIEEIYRVLKKSGQLIISVPTPYTYHWPRLFYPSLFEKQNFNEFLIINGFSCELKDLTLFRNMNHNKKIEEINKRWSWFWDCRKTDLNDSRKLLDQALIFWDQKDNHGIRIKPIEAIELFRKAYRNSPEEYKIKLLFAQSLLYRFYLGDQEEFNTILKSINEDILKPEFQNNADYLFSLLLIDIEAKSLSQEGFGKNFIDAILLLLKRLPGTEYYFNKLKQEEVRLNH